MTAAPAPAVGVFHDRPLPFWPLALLLNAILVPFYLFGVHSGDSDTFYHLAGGRWMFEHGRLLDRETFSYTIAGRPWTNYYWAFEWLLFAAYRVAGQAGVIALRDVLMLLTVNLFLYWVWRRTDGAWPETLAFGLLVLPLYVPRALNIRPHLFSYLFLLVLLVILDQLGRGRWRLAPLVVVTCALWANLHGVEYPVALAAIGLYTAQGLAPYLRRPVAELRSDRAAWRWPLLLATCATAFLVNPFGPAILRTAWIGAHAEVMAQINEMQPVRLEELGSLFPALDLESASFLHYAVLAGALLVPGWLRRREMLPAAFYLLGLALIFNKRRFAVEFLFLAVPFVAAGVARARRTLAARGRLATTVLVAFAAWSLAAAVATARVQARGGNLDSVGASFYPVGALRFLERHGLSGNLHCAPTLAGYVTWTLYPRVRTTMDMRTPEPFGPQELWLATTMGERVSFARVAQRWPVDLVLVARETPLAGRLRSDPSGFAPVYEDPWFVLFAHERALSGKEYLRLRTLPLMEELEAGRIAPGHGMPEDLRRPLREEAERLRDAWPHNNLAQRALLWLLLSEGRFDEAHTRAAALARELPRQGLYPFFDGLALRQLGQPEAAAAAFRRAIDATPEFLLPYPQAADVLLSLGRNDEALDLMERFAHGRWARLSAAEYILLGRTRQRTGRAEAARQAYDRADWLLADGDPLRPELEKERALSNPSGRGPRPP